MEKVADFAKAETSSSTEPDIAVSSQHTEVVPDSNRSANNALLSCSKSSSPVATSEPSSLKQSIRPLAPVGAPFIFNRYKLDNRPTAFKINPPIPSDLANVIFLYSLSGTELLHLFYFLLSMFKKEVVGWE